jgi:hypothetical protein
MIAWRRLAHEVKGKEFQMITTLFIIAFVGLVLFGMIASTERLLNDRQDYVVVDERMIDHRSRL